MRLLSVPWRPRRSFGNVARCSACSPLANRGARGRLLPRPEGFEARRSQRAPCDMSSTLCVCRLLKLSSLMPRDSSVVPY